MRLISAQTREICRYISLGIEYKEGNPALDSAHNITFDPTELAEMKFIEENKKVVSKPKIDTKNMTPEEIQAEIERKFDEAAKRNLEQAAEKNRTSKVTGSKLFMPGAGKPG